MDHFAWIYTFATAALQILELFKWKLFRRKFLPHMDDPRAGICVYSNGRVGFFSIMGVLNICHHLLVFEKKRHISVDVYRLRHAADYYPGDHLFTSPNNLLTRRSLSGAADEIMHQLFRLLIYGAIWCTLSNQVKSG